LGGERFEIVAFEDGGVADGVGDHGAFAGAVEAAVALPRARERTEAAAIGADEAWVVEGARGGIGPTGSVAGFELEIADGARMDDVAAVEVDAFPIDETLARPSAGEAQRVVFEDDPGLAGRDAARSDVEADGDALVGEVRAGGDGVERVAGQLGCVGAAGGVGEFKRADEKRAVVHLAPRLALHGRRADGIALRQAGEIGVGGGDIL
jgi:hypothetical protein